MNPRLAAVLSLIPERVARTHFGATFAMPEAAATCAHPDRLTFIAGRLNWMSPLERITKDEQRALGLLAPSNRPVAGAAEADELESVEDDFDDASLDDADLALEPELAGHDITESERQGSAGTLVAP